MKNKSSNPSLIIKEPESDDELRRYYNFRWKMLREPWQQPEGSEKDNQEETAFHRMVVQSDIVIGVGRLHFENDYAQIRYMAVDPQYSKQGIGTSILESLEAIVTNSAIATIVLHARETAVDFYLKQGYLLIGESHTLYKTIQHYKMIKNFK